MKQKAESEPKDKKGTFVVKKALDLQPPSAVEEQQKETPARDMEAALRQIREEKEGNLQKKHKDKKGIMFEIRLDEEETQETTEEKEEERKNKEEQEVDPLNRTLSFQEGEELKVTDWSKERKGWSQRTPQTLLDALANMDINSVYNTAAEPEEGRRQWSSGPPNSLLNALAQAELTALSLDAGQEKQEQTINQKQNGSEVLVSSDTVEDEEEKEKRGEEEEDSDVEMEEERLEPRSDDDDTNFEESEDELREAVADSMRNLYVMEDSSSDENTQESSEQGEEEEERKNRGTVSSSDHHQYQPEVSSSEYKGSTGSVKDDSSKAEQDPETPCDSQTHKNTALKRHQAT